MAGDWIKVRENLLEDPAVGRMASALGMDKYAVVGRLVKVWTWADQQSRDGHADVAQLYIDDLVSTPGMADAMLLVGWLEVPENGRIRFPKFDRHMSKSAKNRALATRRKQHQRSHDYVTPTSRTSHARSGTREEKSSSTNRHPPVAKNTAPPRPPAEPRKPVQETPQPTTPRTPPAVANGERSMASVLAERAGVKLRTEQPSSTPPDPKPAGLRPGRKRPSIPERDPNGPTDDELLAQLKPLKAPDTKPENDWEATPESIDRAGQTLGMKRMPFEEDPEFTERIRARLALG